MNKRLKALSCRENRCSQQNIKRDKKLFHQLKKLQALQPMAAERAWTPKRMKLNATNNQRFCQAACKKSGWNQSWCLLQQRPYPPSERWKEKWSWVNKKNHLLFRVVTVILSKLWMSWKRRKKRFSSFMRNQRSYGLSSCIFSKNRSRKIVAVRILCLRIWLFKLFLIYIFSSCSRINFM